MMSRQTLPLKVHAISSLYMKLQVVDFQRCECVSHVQAQKLVHVSGVHCHVHACSTGGCAFVYFIV